MDVAQRIQKIQDAFIANTVQNFFYKRRITPNQITYVRFLITGILLLCILHWHSPLWIILILFTIGAFSDMLDGALARNTNQITNQGKIIDPIADKCLIFSLFLISFDTIPTWILYAIIVGELINTLSILCYTFLTKKITQANFPGKVKMTLQVFGVVFVILSQMYQSDRLARWGAEVFVIALFFLGYSMLERLFDMIFSKFKLRKTKISLDYQHPLEKGE